MPPGKKNIPWNHLTQAENYCPLYIVCHAFSYLSSSCYTVPFFLPTAIFIAIIFINPYILAASASPFHSTEPTEMPDFSTAPTEDKTGEHTQCFHRVWPACSWEVLWYYLIVVITQQTKKILSLQMNTDCTETLTGLCGGLDPSIISAERGLRTFPHGGRFWSAFLLESKH